MRTNIVIDDKLMQATLRATGLKTKREVVEEALRTLLSLKNSRKFNSFVENYSGRETWTRCGVIVDSG